MSGRPRRNARFSASTQNSTPGSSDQRPAQYEPAEPVHHRDEVHETLSHPDVRDVRVHTWLTRSTVASLNRYG